MAAPSKQDSRLAWLGGEAHVRRQDEARQWRLPIEWQQGLWLVGALAFGSVIGGGVVSMTRPALRNRRTRTERQEESPRTDVGRTHHHRPSVAVGPLALAFAVGASVGAGLGLMSAPYSGTELRRRLALGVKTAQDEFTDAVEDTREAVGALKKDARQTLRQTAIRMTEVVTATKAALTSEETAGEDSRR